MKKSNVIIIVLVSILAISLYVNSRMVETITISPEVFETLSGCELNDQEEIKSKAYTEEEFETMQKAAEKCWQSKIEYLGSSDNRAGVTSKYEFR